MLDERALRLWAVELGAAMGKVNVKGVERVLEYAYAFGTPIPDKHLVQAFRECFCDPPSGSVLRSILGRMGYTLSLCQDNPRDHEKGVLSDFIE